MSIRDRLFWEAEAKKLARKELRDLDGEGNPWVIKMPMPPGYVRFRRTCIDENER